MNVLVTGGAGLISMALRERLPREGHAVVATDATDYGRNDGSLEILTLDDEAGLDALFDANAIDAVVHGGAISGPMLAKGQPMTMVDVNIVGTARLLDLARRCSVRRFVYCSSIGVYGNVGPGLISEETPRRPTTVYGASKVAGEALVDAFAAEYGLEGVSLRIPRVYGPYRRANCHLGTMIRNTLAGVPTEIPGGPELPFHYMYVDDVADVIALMLSVERYPSRIYNVGTGIAQTMPEIIEIARATLDGAAISLTPGADAVPDIQEAFDVTRIERELGWRTSFDLARGLGAFRDAILAGRAA